MARLDQTTASLRFYGDTLDPDEITRLLGRSPTQGRRKGDAFGRTSVARTGGWWLRTQDRSPGDLNAQIQELLAGLTEDFDVWRDLTSRYRADVFCGLLLRESNEGLAVSPETLKALGDRGLSLGLDIYGQIAEEEPDAPD